MNNTKEYCPTQFYYKDAHRDEFGRVKILLDVGDFIVPVYATPLPLGYKKDVFNNLKLDIPTINRMNLTRWEVDSIEDVTKLFDRKNKKLFDGTYTLYWNGRNGCWKAYNASKDDKLSNIDVSNYKEKQLDKIDYKLHSMISKLYSELYMPYLIAHGMYGEPDKHVVYDNDSILGPEMFTDMVVEHEFKSSLNPEYLVALSNDKVEVINLSKNLGEALDRFIIDIKEDVRSKHKAIPYSQIGEAIQNVIKSMSSYDVGKLYIKKVIKKL